MAQAPLIPSTWQLPEDFRKRLGSTVGRQRWMQSEKHLLIVAHQVPEADEKYRRAVLFWKDSDGQWRASNGDPGGVALELHLDRFRKKLDEFDQLEEKAQRADEYLPLLEGLAPVTRSIRNLLEVLEETRKALPEDRMMIDQRDRAYDLARQAELLFDDAKNSMDVAVVRRAEEQATASHRMMVSAHRLNIMAALFFPFATLGAIFGTTLTDGWSWSSTGGPFALFLLTGLGSGAILAKFVSRP